MTEQTMALPSVNAEHLHLLLNHVPTVGWAVAVGLLLLAFVRRDESLKHTSLELMFVIAVLTLPAYVTGAAAHQALRDQPEVPDRAIRIHQDAALWGFTAIEATGFLAWIGLWQIRRRGRAAPGLVTIVALLSVLAFAITGRAATLGGEIRHPEIRAEAPGASPTETPTRFMTSVISEHMQERRWTWPAAEAVHFLALCLTFGVMLAANLRVLGVGHARLADVHRLLPWGMLGLGANLVTGMLFFVAAPGQYNQSPPFHWKIVSLMIAGATFLYLTESATAQALDKGGTSLTDKAVAGVSIVAWLAVIYSGRMLPFLGSAF